MYSPGHRALEQQRREQALERSCLAGGVRPRRLAGVGAGRLAGVGRRCPGSARPRAGRRAARPRPCAVGRRGRRTLCSVHAGAVSARSIAAGRARNSRSCRSSRTARKAERSHDRLGAVPGRLRPGSSTTIRLGAELLDQRLGDAELVDARADAPSARGRSRRRRSATLPLLWSSSRPRWMPPWRSSPSLSATRRSVVSCITPVGAARADLHVARPEAEDRHRRQEADDDQAVAYGIKHARLSR